MVDEPRVDDDREQAARDKLARGAEAREKAEAEMAKRGNWKPTPTQEECDLVAMGVPVDKVGHAPSGAGPDPHYERSRAMWPARKHGEGAPDEGEHTREMRPAERKPGAGYETR
jgi:hypothetical protein